MQNLTLFCRNCAEFLHPGEAVCACGTARTAADVIPPAGDPLWSVAAPGQPTGSLRPLPAFLALGLNDRWSGRVALIQRETGRLLDSPFAAHNPILGGIVAGEQDLFAVTRGLAGYDGSAQLYGLAVTPQGGLSPRWPAPVPLPENPISAPVLLNGRAYVLCRGGRIVVADCETGAARVLFPDLESPAGWLKCYGARLLAICENGAVRFIQPETGRVFPRPAFELGFSPIRAPEVFDDWLCAAAAHFQSRVLDLRGGEVIALPLEAGKILAEPWIEEERAYVGGPDRCLHAFDLPSGKLAWRSEPQRHSIAARPVSGMGLVAAAVNQVGVVAFDPRSGREVWQVPIPGRPRTFAALAYDAGVFFAATEKGVTYAIPWHGSSYLNTGKWLEQAGNRAGAGTALALAYLMGPEKSSAFLNQALELWRGAGQAEWAARFGEKLLEPSDESIAADFEQAAGLVMDHDRQQRLLRRAEKWYEDAGDRAGVARVRKKAARVRAPYIRIEAVSIPQEFEPGTHSLKCVLTLQNRGTDTAYKVWLRTGGNCTDQRLWMDLQPYLPAGIVIDDLPVELEIPVTLSCSGSLEVLVRCDDSAGKRWEFRDEFPIHVKTFEGIEIYSDVGLLNAPTGQVRIHGMVGMVKMQPEGG